VHQVQVDVVQAKVAQLLAANALDAFRVVENVPELKENILCVDKTIKAFLL